MHTNLEKNPRTDEADILLEKESSRGRRFLPRVLAVGDRKTLSSDVPSEL